MSQTRASVPLSRRSAMHSGYDPHKTHIYDTKIEKVSILSNARHEALLQHRFLAHFYQQTLT